MTLASGSILCSSSPITAFNTFILKFFWDPEGEGVRVLVKNGLFTSFCLTHETSISVSSSLSCLCSIFADWRKLAEVIQIIYIVLFYEVKKPEKFDYSKFPRSNSKIKLWWSTHIKPVPPMPAPHPQVSTPIYFHF